MQVVTAQGSGINWMWYTKRTSNGENDPVDIFFQAHELGAGHLNLVAVWEKL